MTRPSVLIIDDDATICEEVGAGLERHGFLTRTTTEPAGDFLSNGFAPDIIVLDLDMPGVDGFQVIERLGSVVRKPHLIVASGHHPRIISAAARGANAAGVIMLGELEKPYALGALVALLDSYIGAKAAIADDDSARVQRMVRDDSLCAAARVAFQTKRRIATAEIIAFEALLRVSGGAPINPEACFKPNVPLEAQLALTAVVLDEAMAFAKSLSLAGRPMPIAVNCTPAILCEPSFLDIVCTTLARHDVPPRDLLLEITEHSSLNSLDDVAAAAGRMALRQIGIVIDDFGAGTTSFEKLLDLPLSELKIDKRIFWATIEGSVAPGLLKEVIGFCAGHGIRTTVEGIETSAHRALAAELGADYGQGYHWDRPRFVEDIVLA